MCVWKLIDEVERVGVKITVHRGQVLWELPTEQGEDVLDQLLENREEVKQALLEQRGANIDNLLEVWFADPMLQKKFPSPVQFDDFAHSVGVQYIRSLEHRNEPKKDVHIFTKSEPRRNEP